MGLQDDVDKIGACTIYIDDFRGEVRALKEKIEEGVETRNKWLEVVKKKMKAGERLEEPVVDFCVYHFGSEAEEHVEGVAAFINKVKEYHGQNFLIVRNGYIDKQVMRPDHVFEGSMMLAEFRDPACEIEYPSRDIIATTKDLQKFDHSDGWGGVDKIIRLTEFLIPGEHEKLEGFGFEGGPGITISRSKIPTH